MSARRLLPLIVLNMFVSAVVVLGILYWWDSRGAESRTESAEVVALPTARPTQAFLPTQPAIAYDTMRNTSTPTTRGPYCMISSPIRSMVCLRSHAAACRRPQAATRLSRYLARTSASASALELRGRPFRSVASASTPVPCGLSGEADAEATELQGLGGVPC